MTDIGQEKWRKVQEAVASLREGVARVIVGQQAIVEQMLVALFRANPEAFAGNNMNRLAAGKVLTADL